MKQSEKEYREFNKHFPRAISQEIKDYVTNTVLLSSRYVFIKREKGVQFGYCTHCQKRYRTPAPFKHNDLVICVNCGSKCVVKNHGTSRKFLYDRGFVVYYEKSKIDPTHAIIARAFSVSRDYTGDYTQVKTKYIPLAKYLFVAGNPGYAVMHKSHWWGDRWVKCSTVHSVESKSGYFNNCCSIESIRNAVKGTPFEYSTWEQHPQPQCDYVKFFALYSKYPAIEYLTKLGFEHFVRAKLFDKKTYNSINWRGKRINQILKLSTQDIKEVRSIVDRVQPLHLYLYQCSRGDSNGPSMKEIVSFFDTSMYLSDELKIIMKYANLRQIMNYVQRQLEHKNKAYKFLRSVLIDWKDYIKECEELEYDLSNDYYLFPKDLHEAHQRTSKLLVMKANELLDQKILKRVKELKKYYFEHSGFMIRPAESTYELIQEGKKLNHCVGRYADDYANGKTAIFFIRRVNQPADPFFTMELRGDCILQTRGLRNCAMTEEVQKFVNEFERAKLQSKTKQRTFRKVGAI
ncbi:PcfJ domain-containing protein [Paenibacillus phoenicis]|uniref:PcfJ domain-containing protein n=1 Tax=Paenibacillus phoenicis TaxID=554117 RepID=UPI003D2A1308